MRIGIDCGSLTVKGVLLHDSGQVLASEHQVHEGEVLATVRKVLFSLVDGHDRGAIRVALTGRHATPIAALVGAELVDPAAAEVAGARHLFGPVDHVFHLGGGSLMLLSLDADGNLLDLRTNSVCAAGTGSFLDEQATRMGLGHDEANAIRPVANPPAVATRCAVFAKTDLIHRQQEGFSKEEMWCGLCQGMSRTALQTLLKGREVSGRIALTGGVASNQGMVHYLREALGQDLLVSPHSAVCAAVGAALEGPLVPLAKVLEVLTDLSALDTGVGASSKTRRPPLELRRSSYPDFSVASESVDDLGNEVRIHVPLDAFPSTLLLGVDVGSTSTKAALCDEQGRVVVDVYRRTEGDPVGAGRKLLRALCDIEARLGRPLDIRAVGTTGSGRRIMGAILGADLVVNEISAHVRGAVSVDPEVTTIFEIGGQDSKYMRVHQGRIVDCNMNYVCAAGTGTFVEELGRKLGFSVAEIGDNALGATPPHTSDRCTVFMEQDAFQLGREGAERREIMAAILYSVIENYKSKVVGNRPVDRRRVMFQGATARNKGLVAAVENVFGVEVVVSPYCHVMGAIGAALLAREHLLAEGRETAFRGLDLADREVRVSLSRCDLCSNDCVITTAHIAGVEEEPSFGYLCGREPGDKKMRKNVEYAPFRSHKAALGLKGPSTSRGDRPRIGVPAALATYGYAPLFRTLVEALGAEPVFSRETDRDIARLGAAKVGSDFCFPVKVLYGHVASLLDRDDLDGVLVPHMIEEERHRYTTRRRFCPYLNAAPAMVRPLADARPLGPRLVDPIVDFNYPARRMAHELMKGFAGVLDLTEEAAASAWREAVEAQRRHERALVAKGEKVLGALRREGRKGIVIIGRPYNTLDPVVSQNLPLRVSEFGYTVIPMEQLPFRPDLLDPGLRNMYWSYGQKILSAVKQVAKDPSLFAIYLTSFNCGPDSFILTMAEELMGDKPFLILELDEHGADGGYVTRIEAFLDVIRHAKTAISQAPTILPASRTPEAFRGRRLWIPRMHPYTTRLFAAVLRAHGFDAQGVPESDAETHALGKAATRGSECTPMALTLGAFLKAVRDSGLPPQRHALFMPTATGPCRFGSYAQTQAMALRRMGLGDIPIFSPSSENAYLGIPSAARRTIWDAILCGDYLFKVATRTRPYEIERGSVDRTIEKWLGVLEATFEAREDPRPMLVAAAREVLSLPRRQEQKPLAGVVGEIYVRCDPFANAFVVRAVEEAGGEAWLAPLSEWILYTVWAEREHGRIRGDSLWERIVGEFGNLFIERKEHEYHDLMKPLIPDRLEPPFQAVIEAGLQYIPGEFEGESVLTIGRTVLFFEQGADLVVNASPFGCMHGHISGAVFEQIVGRYGRPVVTSFYDGTVGNSEIGSFILAARKRREAMASVEPLSQPWA